MPIIASRCRCHSYAKGAPTKSPQFVLFVFDIRFTAPKLHDSLHRDPFVSLFDYISSFQARPLPPPGFFPFSAHCFPRLPTTAHTHLGTHTLSHTHTHAHTHLGTPYLTPAQPRAVHSSSAAAPPAPRNACGTRGTVGAGGGGCSGGSGCARTVAPAAPCLRRSTGTRRSTRCTAGR